MDFDKRLWPKKESKKPLGERRTPLLKQLELTRGFGAQKGLEPSPWAGADGLWIIQAQGISLA